MKVFILIFASISLTFIGLFSYNSDKNKPNYNKLFEKYNVTGTFVLKNLKTNKFQIHNTNRSIKRYVPASTFKILNTMIALQESVIKSVDDTIKWDGVKRGLKAWNKDQTIRTAFPISCVWFYQELARRIKQAPMQKWISASNYGNCKIDNKIDRFWLDGNLKISAKEQVNFIEQLINNKLPFNKNIQETIKEVMISDSTSNYIIRSKTGWSKNIGWYVGYIETNNNTWIFALNMDMNHINMANIRIDLTYDILGLKKNN